MRQAGNRFWVEAGLGSISGILFVATLTWPDWLELVLHVDPDGGNGAVEWAVLAVFAVVCVICLFLARAEWLSARVHAPFGEA
jgi:hypothetical protein